MHDEMGQADVDSKTAAAEQAKIEFEKKYAQQVIDIRAKTADSITKANYYTMMKGADEIKRLDLQKELETLLAKEELRKKIAANPQMGKVYQDEYDATVAEKKAALDLQQSKISRDELENYRKKAVAEQDSIDKEQERLNVYKENLLASDADLKIALSRLETEQKIAEIWKDSKIQNPADKSLEADRLRGIQKSREAVINQAAELKMLQDMNQSVFNNMGSAIDNFVKTGKLSFKDLTRSIIQDLISIAMRAQMMAMFKGFSFFGGSSASTGASYSLTDGQNIGGLGLKASGQTLAGGGSPQVGMASLVGENGPELFIPNTAGTIIPNGQFGSSSSNAPTVNYNGPYIASMSAIDTQSGVQFLAKNKQAVWAVYQSANRSVPVTR
jgi:lambda family phage tail tape measure protein